MLPRIKCNSHVFYVSEILFSSQLNSVINKFGLINLPTRNRSLKPLIVSSFMRKIQKRITKSTPNTTRSNYPSNQSCRPIRKLINPIQNEIVIVCESKLLMVLNLQSTYLLLQIKIGFLEHIMELNPNQVKLVRAKSKAQEYM